MYKTLTSVLLLCKLASGHKQKQKCQVQKVLWCQCWTAHFCRNPFRWHQNFVILQVPATWSINSLLEHFILLIFVMFLTYFTEQRPSWGVNSSSCSQKILRILWNSKVYYRTHLSLSSARSIWYLPPLHVSKIYFIIIFLSKSGSSK